MVTKTSIKSYILNKKLIHFMQIKFTKKNYVSKAKLKKKKNLVELVGNNDSETEGEPKRCVAKEEELGPSLARIRGQPQTGSRTRTIQFCNCSFFKDGFINSF